VGSSYDNPETEKSDTQKQFHKKLQTKPAGQIHVTAPVDMVFWLLWLWIKKLDPISLRILKLLRLRQRHNDTFAMVNKAAINRHRKV
jgi:hypothetical protein